MTMISTLMAAGAPTRNAMPAGTGLAGNGLAGNGLAGNGPVSGTGPAGPGTVSAGPGGPGAIPMPSRVPAAALGLLRTARHGLAEAEAETDAGTRYIGAHLAALRAAAAIVAARGEPGTGARRRRPRSVWELLPQVEPALAEWAAFFAAARPSGPRRRRGCRGRRARGRRTTCCVTRLRS